MIGESIKIASDGIVLTIQAQPRANKTEFVGQYGDTALKFRIAAPAAAGAANDELCRFLAEYFGLTRSAVVIRAGVGGRRKRVLLKGQSMAQVKKRLNL